MTQVHPSLHLELTMNTTKNVFVSHIHQDDQGLPNLMDLLHKHGMDARNYSITSDKENNAKSPEYIKNEILAPRINACSTFVVYITPDTKASDWVNWEIEGTSHNLVLKLNYGQREISFRIFDISCQDIEISVGIDLKLTHD